VAKTKTILHPGRPDIGDHVVEVLPITLEDDDLLVGRTREDMVADITGVVSQEGKILSQQTTMRLAVKMVKAAINLSPTTSTEAEEDLLTTSQA
jgi:hypothetical protein